MAVGDDCIKEEIVLKNTFLNSRRDESAMSDNNWANKKGKFAIKIGAKKKRSSGASNQGGSVSPAPQKKKSKGLRWADEGNKPKSLITDFYGPIYKGQKLYREGMISAKTILKPDSRIQDGVDNSSAQGGTTPPRAKPRRLLQTEEETVKHLPTNMISTPTGPRNNNPNSSQSQSGSYVNGQLLRPSNSAKRLESGLKKNQDSTPGSGMGYSSAGQRAGSEKRRPNSSQNSNGPMPQNEIATLGPQTSLLSGLPPRTGNLISNTANGKPPTGKNPGSTIKKPQESSIRKDNFSSLPQQHQFFPTYTSQSSNFHDGTSGMAGAYSYHSQKANPTNLDSPQVQDLRDSNEFSNSVNQGSAKKRPASTGNSTTQTHQRILKDEEKHEKTTANNSKNSLPVEDSREIMSKKKGEQTVGDASGDDRSDLFMAYRGNHSALLNTSNNPNRVSPLIPRYEPKPSSRVAAFTSPNDSNKLGLIGVPNRQTPPIPMRPSSSGPKPSDAADENVVKPNGFAASKTTNNTVYQKALKSFLGGREVVTMVSPPQLGLPPSGPTTPSIPRAVKPKRSVLDDNDASHGNGGALGPPNTTKPKRTLLSSGIANSHTKEVTQDEIGYSTFDSISRGAPLKRVLTSNTGSDSYQKPASNSKEAIQPGTSSLGGSHRRPNSAPIKDKDKDKLKPKPNAKGWGEIESRGYQKEGLLRPSNGPPSHLSNSIYNGPVIKKKVLNN